MKSAYHETTPPFWPNNGGAARNPQWQASNCALARLLEFTAGIWGEQ